MLSIRIISSVARKPQTADDSDLDLIHLIGHGMPPALLWFILGMLPCEIQHYGKSWWRRKELYWLQIQYGVAGPVR